MLGVQMVVHLVSILLHPSSLVAPSTIVDCRKSTVVPCLMAWIA